MPLQAPRLALWTNATGCEERQGWARRFASKRWPAHAASGSEQAAGGTDGGASLAPCRRRAV